MFKFNQLSLNFNPNNHPCNENGKEISSLKKNMVYTKVKRERILENTITESF